MKRLNLMTKVKEGVKVSANPGENDCWNEESGRDCFGWNRAEAKEEGSR